ncbi:MAG: hypothetical protein HYX86_02935, partial [Chloroflexi bacterium]|nr:hypothetical protein [Chloroflexota bacterium]
GQMRPLIRWIAGFLITSGAVVGLYALWGGVGCWGAAIQWVWQASARTVSGNALNLNWVITYFLHLLRPDVYGPLMDGMSKYIEGDLPWLRTINVFIVISAILFFLTIFFLRGKSLFDFNLAASAGFLAYFLFGYNVHENHGFLLLVVFTFMVLLRPKEVYFWFLLMVISLFNLANLLLFYGLTGEREVSRVVMGLDMSVPLAMLYILFFIFFARDVIRTIGRETSEQPA